MAKYGPINKALIWEREWVKGRFFTFTILNIIKYATDFRTKSLWFLLNQNENGNNFQRIISKRMLFVLRTRILACLLARSFALDCLSMNSLKCDYLLSLSHRFNVYFSFSFFFRYSRICSVRFSWIHFPFMAFCTEEAQIHTTEDIIVCVLKSSSCRSLSHANGICNMVLCWYWRLYAFS